MKTRLDFATVLALGIVLSLFSACVLAARGDEAAKPAEKTKNVLAELEKAKNSVGSSYKLGYRFQPGETVRTKVVHLATVETKIKGVTQNTKSRTISTRAWKIREVDAAGNITFDNVVERVEMWNSVEGREEVHFDSDGDKSPPAEFVSVAASVGKVLASIKIDPQGRILSRTNNQAQYNPGIGDLTVPFPPADKQPIKPGMTWSIADELKLPLDDGSIKKVQTQQQYKLEKVENGVATIAVATTVLTPINDPKLQSQLVQRLQKGTIKFDIDAGRLIHKQFDIDQQVFGFSGADSFMQYLARLTEEPVKEDVKSAARPAGKVAK
ncbi:MAG TPA: hypothetical protein VGI40_27880 [Pirellulaceae bacterium]|jgi:hypothetical protein